MANPNTPRGLIPYRHYDGSVYNGGYNVYYMPSSSTALYIGDPVDIVSASDDTIGTPAIALGVVNSPLVGVMIGVMDGGPEGALVTLTQDKPVYHQASTAQYIAVCDDPTVIYMIQDDASTQALAPNLWAGRNASLVTGSGSTITGYSGWQLAASTVQTTNTLDLKIMRPLQQADNVIGTAANTNMHAKWLVTLNNRRYANLIAGV